MSDYWALVHAAEGVFGISFPDVPGCVSSDTTIERALAGGREALSAHLAWMRADGDATPVARPYGVLVADPETREIADGATWHLIEARVVQAPRVRVNVMIEPGLLREADAAADARGTTRSALIEAGLRALIGAAPDGVRRGAARRPRDAPADLVSRAPRTRPQRGVTS